MTPYEILGISPEASNDEVRLAYKRAAMKHHPDRGGDPTEFAKVKQAFEALQRRPCPECGGKGYVKNRQGFFSVKENCPLCWKLK